MKSRFVAIDFETCNGKRESAIQLGLMVFEEGVMIHQYETYLKPPKGYDEWLVQNERIHHIKRSTIQDAPSWNQVYPEIEKWLTDTIVVGHNVPFDAGIICALNQLYEIPYEPFDCLDTVLLAKKLYPEIPRHRLTDIMKHLNISLHAHNAFDDAYGCALIVIDAMCQTDIYEMKPLLEHFELTTKSMK